MSDKRKYDGKYWFDDALMALLVKLANSTTSLVFATFGVIIFFGLMYSFTEEDKGPIEGIWWSIVTGFTVGYGDQYPTTTIGRFIGACLIVSMFILALCLGAKITQKLIHDQDEFTHHEQEQIKETLSRIETKLNSSTCGCRKDTVNERDK